MYRYLLLSMLLLTGCSLHQPLRSAHVSPPRPSPQADGAPILIAAHRGGGLEAPPENSLAAFRSAMALGVDFLELDVHLSRDNELIIMHDGRLERTSTGQGMIRSLSLEEILGHKLRHAKAVTEEAIPRLEDLLRVLDDRVQLLLEIKHPVPGTCYKGIAERIHALLSAYGMIERTIVMSFHLDDLEGFRHLAPAVRLGGLMGVPQVLRGKLPRRFVKEAARRGIAFTGFDWRLVDRGLVKLARRHGVLLGAYTVNRPRIVARLTSAALNVIITDRPKMASSLALHPAGGLPGVVANGRKEAEAASPSEQTMSLAVSSGAL